MQLQYQHTVNTKGQSGVQLFPLGKQAPRVLRTGRWVGSAAYLGVLGREKSLPLPGINPETPVIQFIIQGGSNMTGTDLCVNKPYCAAAVRP